MLYRVLPILFNKPYRLHNYELIDFLNAHLRSKHFIINILIYWVGFKEICMKSPEL